jgi:hypothetical protein
MKLLRLTLQQIKSTLITKNMKIPLFHTIKNMKKRLLMNQPMTINIYF